MLGSNNINYDEYIVIAHMFGNKCSDKIKVNLSELQEFPNNPLKIIDIEEKHGQMFAYFLSERLKEFLFNKIK